MVAEKMNSSDAALVHKENRFFFPTKGSVRTLQRYHNYRPVITK